MASISSQMSFQSLESKTMSMISDDVSYADNSSQHSFESTGTRISRISTMSLRYKWVTHWEFIAFAISFACKIGNFFQMSQSSRSNQGNIVQYTTLYIVFGLPAVYMQVVIGQYSQLGATFMKHMIPIGHGFSYILAINAATDTIENGIIMGNIVMYLLSTVQEQLLWMNCPVNHKEKCWGKNTIGNCSKDCINEDIEISSQVFYKKVFMRDFDLETTQPTFGKPLLPRVVVIGLVWLVIFNITRTGISKYKRIIITNCYIVSALLLIIFIVSCLAPGSKQGIALFFRVNASSFFSAEAWLLSVFNVLYMLALYKASYSVYGSYMASTAPSDILTIFYVALHLFVTTFISILTFSTLGILAHRAKTDVAKITHLYDYKKNNVAYITTMLQAIGFLGAPHLWSVVHLMICLLVVVNNQVAEIDVIERCITDLHARLRQYRNYTIGALCLFGMGINILFQSKKSFVLFEATIADIVHPIYPYEMAIFYTLVCWIYGVQKFSDDIHFLTLSQPARFWKICWYLLPAILWIDCIMTYYQKGVNRFPVISLVFTCIYVCPIPIVAVITIFYYLKQHNLPGLIQTQERWGPPDPQERRVRHLFNPREEIRSRRRNDTCKHKCLFASKVLGQTMEQEDETRMYSRDSPTDVHSNYRAGSVAY